MESLQDKVYWVTGASRGIGFAIAKELLRNGARVILSARSSDKLLQIAAELGEQALPLPCDVSNFEDVRTAYRWIEEQKIVIDGLINNAGVGSFAPFSALSIEQIHQMVAVNFLGSIYCTKVVLPAMLQRGCGDILNILSVAAVKAFPNSSVYGATKAAVQMFADALREEVRHSGIRVINVLPGATATEIWDRAMLDTMRDRMMSPEDVAQMVCAVLRAPRSSHPESIILRPAKGDL